MVNIKLKYNFVETPRKFIIARLQIESSAMINLRVVSTKLYFNLHSTFTKSLVCLSNESEPTQNAEPSLS